MTHLKQMLPFVFGTLLVSAWLVPLMPWPLAITVTAGALVLGSTVTWLLSGWVAPRMMGGRPLHDVVGVGTAEALEQAAWDYARELGVRAPRLYIIPGLQANALACGMGPSSAVALTAGMIETLGVRELRAVLAHEMAHLQAGDTFVGCTAIAVGGLARIAAGVLSLALLVALWSLQVGARFLGVDIATEAGNQVQGLIRWARRLCDEVVGLLAAVISRQAEYRADRLGAQLAGRQAMLTALCRIEGLNAQVEPAGWLARMYATHPSVHDRIEALREVAA